MSVRENQILTLWGNGFTIQYIADWLNISKQEVARILRLFRD